MIFLEDLLAVGGRLHGEAQREQFTDFAYDSRLTRSGELFLALRTPRGDGHDYISAALAAGATGVVCTWAPGSAEDATIILTDDAQQLVQRWAARRLQQVAPFVIGVTGSVGKTSTKRAIATLLQILGPTFKSRQSFNSLLGLPIALARLADNQRYAVLEYGSDQFGEIQQLAHLFPPRVAVVTNVGSVHLRAFQSLAGVAREYGALVEALPADGWAILNGDDSYVRAMRQHTAARVMTFGQSANCDLRVSAIQFALQGTRFRIHWRHESVAAFIPLLGEPAISIALAAVGVALVCGMSLNEAAEQLARIEVAEGRLRPLPARNGATLIDDTFNASLPSLRAALRTLVTLPARRRIVILGGLSDPGAHPETAYAEVGTLAGSMADHLICKGDSALKVVQAARRLQPLLPTSVVHTAAAALQALPSDIGEGDLILVKGSARERMERISAGLLAPTVEATQVLVRQESTWRTVRIGAPDRPTWVQIDLDAIANNVRRLQALTNVPLLMVLKADAYGHGAVRVARTALSSGAVALAVATLSEARALREADITAPILVLGYTPPWQAHEAVALGVTCTVFDLDVAQALANAARALERDVRVHVKVDTGMSRLGLQPDQVGMFLQTLATYNEDERGYQRLYVEGLYTHFATADSADESFAQRQLTRFQAMLSEITAIGLRPPLVHAANSAALLRFPAARFDMVRPGIACYGLNPSVETPLPAHFRPALSFYSEIAQVKTLPANTPLSYGGTFVTRRPSQIGTIPVGYADGLRRTPPWREVLVRGRRAPIVGRICMDYALIDVTDIGPVKRGDPVVLIGSQGDERITADDVATWLGTITYEVVTTILPRVPREVEG